MYPCDWSIKVRWATHEVLFQLYAKMKNLFRPQKIHRFATLSYVEAEWRHLGGI